MILQMVNVVIKTVKMLQYNIKLIKNSLFRMILMQYSRIKDTVKLSAYKSVRSYLRRIYILGMCWLVHNIFNFYRIVDLGK
jgi:hypothetical protein